MGLRIALLLSLAAVALAPIAVLGWASRPLLEEVRRQRVEEFEELAQPSFNLFDRAAAEVTEGVRGFQQGIGERNLDLSRLAREDWWWGKKRDLERLRAVLERLAERSGLESTVVRSGTTTLYAWAAAEGGAAGAPEASEPGLAPGWRWDPDEDVVRYMHALPVSAAVGGPPITVAGWRSWPRPELAGRLRARLGEPAGVAVELRGRLPGSLPLDPEPGVLVRELRSPRGEATVAAVIDARGLEVPMAEQLRSALLWVALLGAVAAAALTIVLSRALTRPLARLTDAVDDVAEGQPPAGAMPSGPGELGRLASAVDRMLAREQRERGERRRAERTAAWQEVARRVAHEIRNPLTPIRLAVDNLARASRRGPEALELSLPEESAAILEEVERLDRLVREFSDFARLPRPRPAPADLVPLARRAVEGQLPEGDERTVSLEVIAPEGPVIAPVDADLLALALANLSANAVRALGSSGGTLRLTVDPNAGTPEAPKLSISLEDDGPGIPPELLDALFEPYVSGRAGENVGLGLAMVRQIAAEHGGRVEAHDREQGGACFRLILPRGEAAATAGEDDL
jgi:signal transduction histidine kinase